MQKAGVKEFSALVITLPDAVHTPVSVGDVDSNLYTAHWDHINHSEMVCEFHAVIGQDKELIHAGDFVELA